MGNLAPFILVGTIFDPAVKWSTKPIFMPSTLCICMDMICANFHEALSCSRRGRRWTSAKNPNFGRAIRNSADRVKYVATTAARLQPSPAGWRVEEAAYRSSTRNVIRHNAGLAMLLGRPRTAVAIAQRLAADEPNNAENLVLLGDAYRTLGARTPLPNDDELKEKAKDKARERIRRMTVPEYDKALLADPHGTERWEANTVRSGAFIIARNRPEECYRASWPWLSCGTQKPKHCGPRGVQEVPGAVARSQ